MAKMTKVRGKSLTLSCKMLKTTKRREVKFGMKNAFWDFLSIFVKLQ